MRTRTTLAAGAILLAFLGTSCGKSEAEQQADCQEAITEESTKTQRPEACEDLSQDDYDTLLMHWALQKGLEEMPDEERDMLDYYDDGEVNGSIGSD
jgi:hypothetical protein